MKYLKLVFISLCITFAGCANLHQKFENTVACTVGKDEAQVVSKWWLFGIATDVANGKVICDKK